MKLALIFIILLNINIAVNAQQHLYQQIKNAIVNQNFKILRGIEKIII